MIPSLGATTNREGGALLDSFRLARTLCLAGAAAAGVVAVDTVATTIDDLDAVAEEARAARRLPRQRRHPSQACRGGERRLPTDRG